MIVMKKVSVLFEDRIKISKELTGNENNFCNYEHSDLILRAIRFIVDQKYELESEVNELWQSYPGVKSVRIVFKNPEDDRSDCGKHLLLLMLKQASQVDQDLRVVRNVWNSQKIYLKTLEWNLAVRVKMFYIYILQDYDPSGVPISRPYIITSKDAAEFQNFTDVELFQFVDSAVALKQHLQMIEKHDALIEQIQSFAPTLAPTNKFTKLTKRCKVNRQRLTENKYAMAKQLVLDVRGSLKKAEKWFQTLIDFNGVFAGFKLKIFVLTDKGLCTVNELLNKDLVKKLSFDISDREDGRYFSRTTSTQLNYLIYIALCLGLAEQLGFPYLLIAVEDFCGGFHQKIQEILLGMNENTQFVVA